MTTKAEERKALEQIRKIVEGLGENSYVATAFEGCFDIAEQNIDLDMACSYKQAAETAQKHVAELNEEIKGLRQEIKGDKEVYKEVLERERECQQSLAVMVQKKNEYKETLTKTWNELCEEQNKVADLEQMVMSLKAKLYDYMVAEKVG